MLSLFGKSPEIRTFEEVVTLIDSLEQEFAWLSSNRRSRTELEFPVQVGLPFRLYISYTGDELHLHAGEAFWCEWFPASLKAGECLEVARGVLSGRYRIVERWRHGSPISATIETPIAEGDWAVIESWGRLRWSSKAEPEIHILKAIPKT